MRIGKYIVNFLILCFVVLLTGEIYRGYAVNFGDYYSMEFTDVIKGEYEKRFEKVSVMLKEHNIDFCVVDYLDSSDNNREVVIYCDEEMKERLIRDYQRYECTISSLVAEKVSVCYKDISQFTKREIVAYSNQICLFFDGDITSLTGVVYENFEPTRESEESYGYYIWSVRVIWAFAFLIFLLLTLVECHFQKKEWFVRICYGYSAKKIMWSYLCREIISYILIFLFATVVLRHFSVLQFENIYILMMGLVFVLVDSSIILFSFYGMNYKLAFQKSYASKKLLNYCYVLRVILLSITITLMSSVVVSIIRLIPLLEQDEFYQQYDGYAHIQLIGREFYSIENPDYDAISLHYEFYRENLEKYDMQSWYRVAQILNKDGDTAWVIEANCNSEEHVKELFAEYSDYDFAKKRYVFLPWNFAEDYLQENEKQFLGRLTHSKNYLGDTEVITYDSQVETRAFDGSGGHGMNDSIPAINPIIILDMRKEIDEEELKYSYFVTNLNSLACRISEEQLAEYLSEHEEIGGYLYVDIYEAYLNRIAKEKQTLLMLLVIGILMTAMDLFVMRTIINMEQEMNALENSLKKITGSPFWVRYQNIFLTTITAGIISILVSQLISKELIGQVSVLGIVVGIVFIVLEMTIVIRHIVKWERMQIQKILKGGCIS